MPIATFCERLARGLRRRSSWGRSPGAGSDFARWGRKDNLSPTWDGRTEQIARLVPSGSAVLEFGAGRMVLRGHLPPGCTYTPSDLVDRGPGTVVCDLNAESLPPFDRHDVAVFSGVLEYVHDVPRLVRHLSRSVDLIVASYATIDAKPRGRRAAGWVNDYRSADLLAVFAAAGFACDHTERWTRRTIYRFRRGAPEPPPRRGP